MDVDPAQVDDAQLHVRFIRADDAIKQEVPSYQLAVLKSSESDALNRVLNQMLENDGDDFVSRKFDFLIKGTLLRQPLVDAVDSLAISHETVVELECILATDQPNPDQSLALPDWVCGISARQDYFVTSCYDNAVRVHNFEGETKAESFLHAEPVRCVKILSDSDGELMLVSGSHDQHAIVWGFDAVTDELAAKMVRIYAFYFLASIFVLRFIYICGASHLIIIIYTCKCNTSILSFFGLHPPA